MLITSMENSFFFWYWINKQVKYNLKNKQSSSIGDSMINSVGGSTKLNKITKLHFIFFPSSSKVEIVFENNTDVV